MRVTRPSSGCGYDFYAGSLSCGTCKEKCWNGSRCWSHPRPRQDAPLEFLVNHSRENSGQICIQPVESFVSILECSFVFESKFAVFDFGTVEMQVEYSRPETVTRVLDGFRSAVALYARGMERRPTLVRK
jgi:hypothetical protein